MAPGAIFSNKDASAIQLDSGTTHTTSTIKTTPTTSIKKGTQPRKSYLLRRNAVREPIFLTAAEGNWWNASDDRGTWRIFDSSGGAAVSNIGHGNRRVRDIMRNTELDYVPSADFETKPALDFAEWLIKSTDYEMASVVFYGSGSEVNEAAKKIARQFHAKDKVNPEPSRQLFIARDRSYHGATLGALELSGHRARKDIFRPILPEVTSFISPCYLYRGLRSGETETEYVMRLAEELEQEIQRLGPKNVAGFFMEPVVGAALGCVPALQGYLTEMKKVCRRHGVLLIFDEVMCGMGRTGSMHAWQDEGVVPDIQLIGKGLAGGYQAISAMLLSPEITDAIESGSGFNHGHTFQTFPLGCATGLAVQELIDDENLLANVREKGALLKQKLDEYLKSHMNVGDIRGKGLFLGLEFVYDKMSKAPFPAAQGIAWKLHEQGLTREHEIYVYPGAGTADGINGDHIIIAPAFNVTDEDIEYIVTHVHKLVTEFFEEYHRSNATIDLN